MLGILLIAPPRLSETFIAIELDELERQGVPLQVFALRGATAAEGEARPGAAAGSGAGWRDRLLAPRRAGGRGRRWLAGLRDHLQVALGAPAAYQRLMARKVVRRSAARCAQALRGKRRMSWSHVREFRLAVWLAARCRAHGIRHLHAHYASSPAAVAGMVAELTGISTSFTAHAKDAFTSSPVRLAKKVRGARFVVGCSSAVAEMLRELVPEAAGRIHTIQHGLSPAVLQAQRDGGNGAGGAEGDGAAAGGGGPPLILAAGRLVEKKGFDVLVAALAHLRKRGCVFQAEIVGAGRCRGPLRAQARALGLDGSLRLRGALPHAQLARRYGAAACFVMPSRVLPGGNRDGIPNVLLEAMASGVPPVATAVGGIPEVIEDGRTGWLVPADDADRLAAAIERVLADPAAAGRLAGAARRRVVEGFDLVRNVGRLVELFGRAGALPPPATDAGRHRLRVGYIVKRYPRLSQTFVLQEILEQERQGTAIHIISRRYPDEGRFHADLARVRAGVTYLPGGVLPGLGRLLGANLRRGARAPRRYLRALGLALRSDDRHRLMIFLEASLAAAAVEARRLQHLHAHFASGNALLALLVSTLTGVPYSFTAHARDLFRAPEQPAALRRKVARAACVVTVSAATREFLCERLDPALRERVVMIHNGVKPELLADVPATPVTRCGTPLVVAVGRLVPKKGFMQLLEAVATLRRGGLRSRLVIAGRGPERRRLLARARELGLPLWLVGALPHGRALALMRRARVVALPAVVDGDGDRDALPTVLLEAQALGLPVVASRIVGIPEIVADAESGLLVEPGDVAGLAAALERLLRDPALAERLGAAGRRRIAARFAIAPGVRELRRRFAAAAAAEPLLADPLAARRGR